MKKKNKRNFKKIIATTCLILVLSKQNTVFAISDDFWNILSFGIENAQNNIVYRTDTNEEMEELKSEIRKDQEGIFSMKNMYRNLNEKGIRGFYTHNLVRFEVSTNSNQRELKIRDMVYKNSKEDIENIKSIVKQKTLGLNGRDNIEKLHSAYETVIEDLSYGFISGVDNAELLERNVIQGLAGNKVVCEAYSYYMAFFMDELGFNNRIVTGRTDNDSINGHMWNIVEVDGKWYVIDATWGDFKNKNIRDKYFLAGKDDLTSHVIDEGYKDIYNKVEKKNYFYNEAKSNSDTQVLFNKNKDLLNTILKNREILNIKLNENKISDRALVLEILNIYDENINNLKNSTKKIDLDINSNDFWNKEVDIKKDINNQRADLTLLNNNVINFIVNNQNIASILNDENQINSDEKIKAILLKEYKKQEDIENSKKYFETLSGNNIKDIDINTSNDSKSYIKGYSDNTFRPNNSVSRAEAATMIGRLIKGSGDFDNDGITLFTDIENEWYSGAILFVSEKNLIKGYSDNTFRPNKNITRAEFATIIANYLGDIDVNNSALKDINNHWAKNSINKVYSKSIINGYPDKTFRPDLDITRAEAVTILNKVFNIENKNNKDVVFSDVFEKDWFYENIMNASN